jgi:hypothetical protein
MDRQEFPVQRTRIFRGLRSICLQQPTVLSDGSQQGSLLARRSAQQAVCSVTAVLEKICASSIVRYASQAMPLESRTQDFSDVA